MASVGFVGLGNMGGPMVRCLAKAGHAVCVHDARETAVAPFRDAGSAISVADTLPTLARQSDIVITMLPNSAIVRAVCFGSPQQEGLTGGLKRGSLMIDMSSSYPLDTVKLGGELARIGVGLLDAPVSGGVTKAVAGTLAIMTGGEPEHVDRAEPVLAAMGAVHRTGKLGSGHAMKALNNYVSAAGLIATCEALAVGQAFGLDGATMTRVLNASTGRNNTTENKVEKFMLTGAFNSGFALALMEKDVAMAKSLAEELGIAADELEFVTSILHRAAKALGPDADHTAVYKYVADTGGAD